MKINTTLTELNLDCDEIRNKKWKTKEKMKSNKTWTANQIGAEGASAISESLKINTTLTELNLGSDEIWNKNEKQNDNEE